MPEHRRCDPSRVYSTLATFALPAVANGLQLRCETSCGGRADMGLTEPHGVFGEPAKQPGGKNMIVAIL